MMLFNHGGRFGPGPGRMLVHHGWWWFFGGVVPLLFFLLLIGLVVWAVLRISGRGVGGAGFASAATVGPALHRDPALEEVRLRYARGEMSREEFVRRSQDLGRSAPAEPGGEPAQPAGGGTEPTQPQAG
jgi:uncharacterized membrane protein